MFDVPDPFFVYVLLLTHEFMYTNVFCLPHSWYPQCDSPSFLCAYNSKSDSHSWIYCSWLSWQLFMLDCLLILLSAAMSQTALSLFPTKLSPLYLLRDWSIFVTGYTIHRNITLTDHFIKRRFGIGWDQFLLFTEFTYFLQHCVYFTLADPAMPISPTYVAAGYPLCKPFVIPKCRFYLHYLCSFSFSF